MLFIETNGTWREIGRQIGEAFRDEIQECVECYASDFIARMDLCEAAVGRLRQQVDEHFPPLKEETSGMAEGCGMPEEHMFVYRFFNEVTMRMRQGCSVLFTADGEEGPLIGRNCDLAPGREAELQLCHTCRPDDGAATVTVTYLGLSSGQGLNEYGLGLGGASAHTDGAAGVEGLPGGILHRMMLERLAVI